MANNRVTVSGMFGAGHTYFADSPVVIDIKNLYWGNTVTSPFTVVRVEVIYPIGTPSSRLRSPSSPSASESAIAQLTQMFPNSNAPFYTSENGYINGAVIAQITDSSNVTHDALVVTSYTEMQMDDVETMLADMSMYSAEQIMSVDYSGYQCIVELDSTQARCDTLLSLCSTAYGGSSQGGDDQGGDEQGDNQNEYVSGNVGNVVGEFRADTGGQTEISFDISSALRAIWSGYDFGATGAEVAKANAALTGSGSKEAPRNYRSYALRIYTEYLSSDDGGVFTTTQCEDSAGNTLIPGGQCMIGGLTELERSRITSNANRDASAFENSNLRNGDASTKPTSTPEIVGRSSITSWVDVSNSGTQSVFYPANTEMAQDGQTAHAPTVLRDSIDYVDFLFVNRRGAVETCSGLMKEAMDIEVTTTQYARVERPTFAPSRSLMAIASGGRRSWSMSSGYQTREWAEWWAQEFLMARQWWMRYPFDATGTFVPVIVTPAKKSVSIYDRTKQQMPHVDFTVTLALEG